MKKRVMEAERLQGKDLGGEDTVNELQKKPEVVVFAGPNGSGKSTFTELLRPNVDYINADEILS